MNRTERIRQLLPALTGRVFTVHDVCTMLGEGIVLGYFSGTQGVSAVICNLARTEGVFQKVTRQAKNKRATWCVTGTVEIAVPQPAPEPVVEDDGEPDVPPSELELRWRKWKEENVPPFSYEDKDRPTTWLGGDEE